MGSRVVETKLLITGQDAASKTFDQVAKAARGSAKALAEFEKAGKASKEVDRLTQAMQRQKAALASVEQMRKAAAARASADMSAKLAASRLGQVTKALDAARAAEKAYAAAKPGAASADLAAKTQLLVTQQKNAQREVRATHAAVRVQTEALNAARQAVSAYGAPFQSVERHQKSLRDAVDRTTRAIREQEAAEKRASATAARLAAQDAARAQRRVIRREALGTIGAAGGVVAAHRGQDVARQAVTAVKSFDEAVRYQHIAGGVSEQKQQEVMIPSAKRIAQETRFTNTDIVEAQTRVAQSLPMKDSDVKADVAASITEQARHYAVIMKSDMTGAAEAIRSFLQTTQKDITTAEKAVKEASRATNLVVAMSKLGGLSDEDAQQFVKYAFPTATAAGLSDTTVAALGSVGRRGGLRGDELGVFVRSAASKLVAPTSKGLDALTVAGIDYNKFTKMPGGLSVENLEGLSKRRFGKAFSGDQRSRLRDLLEDGDVVSNRDEFTKQVSEIVAEGFDKKKDGGTKAQDSQKIAKMVGDFHKLSIESVDAEALLAEILQSPKMTLALKNAFFTDKHGGKASIVGAQFDQLVADRDSIRKAADDPTFSSDKSKYMIAGVSGALENLEGSWENLVLQIGEANKGIIKFTADGLGGMLDMFSKLDPKTQQIASLAAGGVAVAGGAGGAFALARKLTGAGELSGSAAELTLAAKALDAAAVKLAGGSPDIDANGSKKKGGLGKAAKVVGGVASATIVAGVVKELSDAAAEADPSGVTNDAASDPMLMTGGGGLAGRVVALTKSRLEEDQRREVKRGALDAGLDALSGISRPARDQGAEIGKAAGQGIVDGVKEKAPDVLEQGKSIYEGLQNIFRDPLSIPMNFAPGSGGGAGGGGLIRTSYGGSATDVVRRAGGGIDAGRVHAGGGGWGVRSPRRGRSADGGYTSDESWYDAVIKAEGTANGGRDPYNTVLGYGAYGAPEKPLTEMTLAEAYKFGRKVRSRHGSSSAIGAFQIVGRTMKDVMAEAGLGWGDKFTPENQRRLADIIRKRQGFGAWEGFKQHPGELRRARDGVRRGSAPGAVAKEAQPPISMPPKLPDAPPGGLAPARGDGEMLKASAEMLEAAQQFKAMRLNAMLNVELTGSGRDSARVKGMRATSDGPISADMGISMPQTRATRPA